MAIPLMWTHSSAQIATSVREVCCEKCGNRFWYLVARQAIASKSSFLGLGKSDALAEADDAAYAAAGSLAALQVDPVPCPSCGWIEDAVIKEIRARRLAVPTRMIWYVIAWAVLVAVLGPLKGTGDMSISEAYKMSVQMGTTALIFFLPPLLIWRQLRTRWNRNSFETLHPKHKFRLAPPALIRQTRGGCTMLVPARPVELIRRGRSIVVQLAQFGLPLNCFGCGARAADDFHPPIALDDQQKTYPCCEKCQVTLARRWWTLSLLTAAVVAITSLGLILFPWPLSRSGLTGVYILGTFFGVVALSVLSIVIPNIYAQPLRTRNVDKAHGWVSLRAANPEFQRMLEEYFSDPKNFEIEFED